jgi:hypothetical protein
MIVLTAALAALVLAACDNAIIKSWYDDSSAPIAQAAPLPSSECAILAYYFKSPVAVGVITGQEIAITYPHDTTLPTNGNDIGIVHTGDSVTANGPWAGDAASGYTRDYTLTAEDGTTKSYLVRATEDIGSSDCELLLYYFESPPAVGVITGQEIAITYPAGTDISDGTETVVVSTGALAVPVEPWQTVDGGFVRTYTVTAQDGTTKKHYRVRATQSEEPPGDDGEMLVYYFAKPVAVGTITDQGTGIAGDPIKVDITYPADTDFPIDDKYIKTISIGGTAEADEDWVEDASGVQTRAYTVNAEDGTPMKHYRVRAREGAAALSSDCAILAYFFESPPAVGTITDQGNGIEGDPIVITMTNPFGTRLPDDKEIVVVSTGASAVPVEQWTLDGSDYVRTYIVTAQNGATKYYLARAVKGADPGTNPMPTESLKNWLDWVAANAEDGGDYAFTIPADETPGQRSFFYGGKNVRITLTGGSTEKKVKHVTSRYAGLFGIGANVTLTLGGNVTLLGPNAGSPLVSVRNGGTLVMEAGSKITDNAGGGVHINFGTFIMNGGTISGNTGTSINNFGGVSVAGGTFTKTGGIIYGSDASLKNTAMGGDNYGHAVYINNGAKKRNTTAGTGVTLDSSKSAAEGGWE